MRWRTAANHKLIALKDVRKLTGLDPAELLQHPDTQALERIDEHGGREELVRVPLSLLRDSEAEG
jgi:hypothetical protein